MILLIYYLFASESDRRGLFSNRASFISTETLLRQQVSRDYRGGINLFTRDIRIAVHKLIQAIKTGFQPI